MTKVVVLEKFKKNWEIGSVVTVKDGYARNFLLSQGKALRSNKKNLEIVSKKKEELNKKDNEIKKQFIKISEKINKKSIKVKKETKENGELYASIKPKEIVSLIEKSFQVEVEPSSIELKKDINSVGKFEIQLNLHAEVKSNITIEIIKHQAS